MAGIKSDFDGDGRAEILVTSPWGIGILKLSGSTLNAPMMAANGTRFGGWLLNTADNQFNLWLILMVMDVQRFWLQVHGV